MTSQQLWDRLQDADLNPLAAWLESIRRYRGNNRQRERLRLSDVCTDGTDAWSWAEV